MSKLNKFQKASFIIFILPILAVVIGRLTEDYRYSTGRQVYLIGVASVYLFWTTAVLWSLVNAIFIYNDLSIENKKVKFIWTIFSLIPIIFIAINLFIFFIVECL